MLCCAVAFAFGGEALPLPLAVPLPLAFALAGSFLARFCGESPAARVSSGLHAGHAVSGTHGSRGRRRRDCFSHSEPAGAVAGVAS